MKLDKLNEIFSDLFVNGITGFPSYLESDWNSGNALAVSESLDIVRNNCKFRNQTPSKPPPKMYVTYDIKS